MHHAAPEKLSVDPTHHLSCSAMEDFQKADQSKTKSRNLKIDTVGGGRFTGVGQTATESHNYSFNKHRSQPPGD